jgi:hypothetical protein
MLFLVTRHLSLVTVFKRFERREHLRMRALKRSAMKPFKGKKGSSAEEKGS